MNKALSLHPQSWGSTLKHDPIEWGVTKRIEYKPEENAKIAVSPLVYDLVCERDRECKHADPWIPQESIVPFNATLIERQAKRNEMEYMTANEAIRAYCKIKTMPIHDVVRKIDIVV